VKQAQFAALAQLSHKCEQSVTAADSYSALSVDCTGVEFRLQLAGRCEYVQDQLWVADTRNHKIKLVDPRDGSCKTVLGGYILVSKMRVKVGIAAFEPLV